MLVTMTATEYLAHGWDLATGAGLPAPYSDDEAEETLRRVQQTLKPGSFSYFRINPDLRGYAPIGKYAVLAMRVEYGGLFTETANGASPFTQRFFFGGQNEQRGYSSLAQGPKVGADPCDPRPGKSVGCTQPFATTAVPIGGKAAALVSVELRIPADFILNHLGIVPFIDASNVSDDPSGARD